MMEVLTATGGMLMALMQLVLTFVGAVVVVRWLWRQVFRSSASPNASEQGEA